MSFLSAQESAQGTLGAVRAVGYQAQYDDQGGGYPQGLTEIEQIKCRIAIVLHQNQGAAGRQSALLQDHLTYPTAELLVPESLLLEVPNDLGNPKRQSGRPAEHMKTAEIVAVATETHDLESRGLGAMTG